VIGHRLGLELRPANRTVWDRLIAIGFAVGSLCFFVGQFPGFVELVGTPADGAVFFAGSVFFTLAATMEVRESTVRRGRRWGRDAGWWSAAVQWIGTLFFNISTYAAMQDGLSVDQTNKLVWAPDAFGSAAFLISGALAYAVAERARHGGRRDRDWTTAAVNLAGCVFFGISAVASYIVPSTGSTLDLAAANFTTALGALCFFVGAVLIFPTTDSRRNELCQTAT
jgi:hypothetical protein